MRKVADGASVESGIGGAGGGVAGAGDGVAEVGGDGRGCGIFATGAGVVGDGGAGGDLLGLLLGGIGEPGRSGFFVGFGLVAAGLLIAYGKWAAAYFRQADPGPVILDEYAGFAVTVLFVPVPERWLGHPWWLFGFVAGLYVLFRLTDTLKIPPSNWLERLPWGWGILCDDLSAGVQANVVAQVVVRMWLR